MYNNYFRKLIKRKKWKFVGYQLLREQKNLEYKNFCRKKEEVWGYAEIRRYKNLSKSWKDQTKIKKQWMKYL